MSEIKVNKVSSRTGNAVTLGTSGDTFTIPAGVTLTNSGTATGFGSDSDISWQSVQTSNFTAVAGRGYPINTTGGVITLTLPASPSAGDMVAILDYAGTFGTNAVTIGRNSSNIQGTAADGTINTSQQATSFVYIDSTKGWIPFNDNTTGNYGASYVAATGGTVATVGDYKIHSFTSSSNFVVSSVGNSAGSNSVDYLVVGAGGGGGNSNGGGGGAGGFRMAPDFSVSAQTYPITIGAGGAGQPSSGPADSGPGAAQGSSSVFSTITSAGGGLGGSGKGSGPYGVGGNGGSGGGGGTNNQANGSGNTPPVSPAQGTDGGYGAGPGTSYSQAGGGGGGAGQVGGSHKPGGGPAYGGDGSPATPVFGSAPQPFYIANGSDAGVSATGIFAGGGGGGRYGPTSPNKGLPSGEPGGDGGGGHGTDGPETGHAGIGNTGGGGGGGGYNPPAAGGTGGSGIVLIRYKYQ